MPFYTGDEIRPSGVQSIPWSTHKGLLDERMLGNFAGIARLICHAVCVQAQTGVNERNSGVLETFVCTLCERVINAGAESLEGDELVHS